jgi:hypothetical protein
MPKAQPQGILHPLGIVPIFPDKFYADGPVIAVGGGGSTYDIDSKPKRLVQLRGTNGSGKSFSLRWAVGQDEFAYMLMPIGKTNGHAICTVLPKYETIILGPYHPDMKTPGVDRFRTIADLKERMDFVIENYVKNTSIATVIYEGSMASSLYTSMKRFMDDHLDMHPAVLFCNPTLDQCYERLLARGSSSNKTVADKFKAVETCKQKFLTLAPEYEVGVLDTFLPPEQVWASIMDRSWRSLR